MNISSRAECKTVLHHEFAHGLSLLERINPTIYNKLFNQILISNIGPRFFFFWLISNPFQATLQSINCYQLYFACCSERNHHTAKVNHLLSRESGSGIQNEHSSVAKQQESVLKLEEELCTVIWGHHSLEKFKDVFMGPWLFTERGLRWSGFCSCQTSSHSFKYSWYYLSWPGAATGVSSQSHTV